MDVMPKPTADNQLQLEELNEETKEIIMKIHINPIEISGIPNKTTLKM